MTHSRGREHILEDQIITVIVKRASAASELRGRIVRHHSLWGEGTEGRGRAAVMCLRIRQFGGYGLDCGMCKMSHVGPLILG